MVVLFKQQFSLFKQHNMYFYNIFRPHVFSQHLIEFGLYWKIMESTFDLFSMGLVHCSRDPQVQKNVNVKLKLGFTTLFTYLKIILLQCF